MRFTNSVQSDHRYLRLIAKATLTFNIIVQTAGEVWCWYYRHQALYGRAACICYTCRRNKYHLLYTHYLLLISVSMVSILTSQNCCCLCKLMFRMTLLNFPRSYLFYPNSGDFKTRQISILYLGSTDCIFIYILYINHTIILVAIILYFCVRKFNNTQCNILQSRHQSFILVCTSQCLKKVSLSIN